MKEWSLEHPWLTFTLFVLLILVFDNAICNYIKSKSCEKTQTNEQNTE